MWGLLLFRKAHKDQASDDFQPLPTPHTPHPNHLDATHTLCPSTPVEPPHPAPMHKQPTQCACNEPFGGKYNDVASQSASAAAASGAADRAHQNCTWQWRCRLLPRALPRGDHRHSCCCRGLAGAQQALRWAAPVRGGRRSTRCTGDGAARPSDSSAASSGCGELTAWS